MPQSGKQARAVDMGRDAERRVHQHGRWPHPFRQKIIDVLGVEPRDGRLRKQAGKEAMPGFRQFVQGKLRPRDPRMDGEKPRACRRFKDEFVCAKPRRLRHHEADAGRGRELLEFFAFFRPARMGGKQRRDLFDHGERTGGAARLAQDAGTVFAQEQNGGGFGGFISVLPDPGAMLIARLERRRHRSAQKMRIERKPALQGRNKLRSGGQQFGGFGVLRFGQARGRGRLRGRRSHGKNLSGKRKDVG